MAQKKAQNDPRPDEQKCCPDCGEPLESVFDDEICSFCLEYYFFDDIDDPFLNDN